MRSSERTTWAAGWTFATRNSESAPASFRRVSCGTMSTSSLPNFSTPAAGMLVAASAFLRPASFDSPQGLLINMRPGFLAPRFAARATIASSTSSSTAETRKT